ncbi:hypothetical protein L2E82_13941 [Cichorium intybus]|uniref:Uncharacterized protein n=1 Tax=Cichorium intybus TaxID=13427 RepID=A0ACB9EY04_CICIN|nr:hypothetical protein L1887_33577 [Cichorium endivia]KAI3763943.1 hypothetical protein L2E82_13941 [Cichorium intybus]
MDQIILHLSWRKNIKKFIFENGDYYKLPCSFFSWQGLEHLVLKDCDIKLPLMFICFSMLKSLVFEDITITANTLKRFLTGCPLLEEFALIGCNQEKFSRANKCTFVELFKCLPSVQVVNISRIYTKQFTLGGMPQKLPTSLVHLRILVLEVCIHEQHELSSILCLIHSSPNLEKIKMRMVRHFGETFNTLVDLQDYSGLNLDHLKELEITSFNCYALEMEFVKLIMAKSHVLKKARINLNYIVSVDEEVKMLRDLLLLPFPRASAAAKLIIDRR